ncbi:ABC transporter substrate-binding protein [Nocardioides baekrokdamisoli]|uniref:ABC transporter substrate-binding protein n=1 Tax=Nocardioides baekrokdamisoli TaxID=1804624 RepID=A0A3G9IBT3_9ACTN|nr:MCE family protein [Nocardioides baekrokdamisoli]BBH15736.1 ABC transporter substrate-binding protein [Nocardioides baekrokdamisoli]
MARGKGHSDRRTGVVGAVVVALIVAFALNAGNVLGWIRGSTGGSADFTEIGGLLPGDPVAIAGIDVGHVTKLTMEPGFIRVSYSLDQSPHLGDETRAVIAVRDVLGSKELDLVPAGTGVLQGTIPISRTQPVYDLTTAFGDVTTKVQSIDVPALQKALNTVATELRGSGPDLRGALKGLSALSTTLAARNDDLDALLQHANVLTASLDRSKGNVVQLLHSATLLLNALAQRKQALSGLIVHTRELADELSSLVADNQKQIGPALQALGAVALQLEQRRDDLARTIKGVSLFARVFVNTIGSGPWFDSYIGNAPDSLKLESPQ